MSGKWECCLDLACIQSPKSLFDGVQVLGAKKKTLAGFSTATARPHQGFIWNSEVIQQTPPAYRNKASRLVGAKCTLLARMDAYGQDPSGQAGDAMKV